MAWKIEENIPALTTDEIVKERVRARMVVKILENKVWRLLEEEQELTAMRGYVRSLMREMGKRIIQERLF